MRTEFCCDSIVHYDGYKKPKGRNAMTGIRSMVAAAAASHCWQGRLMRPTCLRLHRRPSRMELCCRKKWRRQQSQPELRGRKCFAAIRLVNPPAGTVSFALVMTDPEGRRPLGVDHWMPTEFPLRLPRSPRARPASRLTSLSAASAQPSRHLCRPVHAAGTAASLHLRSHRDRPGPEGAAAGPDPA